jgi:oxaloacetate decarboxylase gamma subunit
MQESLLSQGLDLLVYGIGSVYVFLALLILMTFVVSKLVVRFFPEAPAPVKPVKSTPQKPADAVDPRTLQVIHAAIQQHRVRHLR